MPIRSLAVRGYRSIQRVSIRLGQVNVIVGPNGCGKSNLYRSLFLLAAAADGRLARTLAQEGGMPSALWAGEQLKGTSKRIGIEVGFDQWAYSLSCGLPMPSDSAFQTRSGRAGGKAVFQHAAAKVAVCTRKNGWPSFGTTRANRSSSRWRFRTRSRSCPNCESLTGIREMSDPRRAVGLAVLPPIPHRRRVTVAPAANRRPDTGTEP